MNFIIYPTRAHFLSIFAAVSGKVFAGFKTSGLTGFDSKMNGYVSMPSLAMTLVNLDREQQLAKTILLLQPNLIKLD